MRVLIGFILALSVSLAQDNQDYIDVVVTGGSMYNFCQTQIITCANKPSKERYNGMQGRLALSPITKDFGVDVHIVRMADGSAIFFANRENNLFTRTSGLIKLSTHLKTLDVAGKPIVENGSVLIDKVVLADSGISYKYLLSTGNEIWSDTFKTLKAFLPYVPKEHEENFASIIDSIRINHDGLEDKFFISIETPLDDPLGNLLVITPYVGFQEGKAWLRFKFYYIGKDWLFINKALVKTGDNKKTFENLPFNRDHSGGFIWEWYDRSATEEDIQLIRDIITSDEATVRFYGEQRHYDKTITSKQKQQLKNILWVYEILQ